MLKYITEWNHFKGLLETNISFYNLDSNIAIEVHLYRTSNSLEVDYKVIQSNRNNGIYNTNILEKGCKTVEITYNQFQKPTKKVYLAKIEKALNDILTKYFTIEEVIQENEVETNNKKVIVTEQETQSDNIVLTPIQQLQQDIFNKEHKKAIEYFINKYSHLQIGDIIHIKTQKELDYLEFIDYDEVIRIYEDSQDDNKVKAIVQKDITDYYNKNPTGYVS